MKGKNAIKISDEGLVFLKNMKRNRIKMDADKEGASYWELLEIISKYFKIHNDNYLKLIKMKLDKHGI